jgi:hypothetical protein
MANPAINVPYLANMGQGWSTVETRRLHLLTAVFSFTPIPEVSVQSLREPQTKDRKKTLY